MIPVGFEQKPLLEYVVRLLKHNGVTDILLLVGYKAEQICNYFGDGSRFGVKLSYIYGKPRFNGTGGAVLNAYGHGAIQDHETLLVYYGDILSDINLSEMLTQHLEKDAIAKLPLQKVIEYPWVWLN